MKKTVFCVLDELKENLYIKKFSMHYYPKQSLIQDRIILNKNEKEILQKALKLKSDMKLPFWEAIFLNFFENDYVSEKIFNSALLHNKKTTFYTNKLSAIHENVNKNFEVNISLDSRVKIKKTTKHLFLIDFHIPPSAKNIHVVRGVLQTLNVKGYILNSGESYHFISKKCYSYEKMSRMLIKTLFFSPIIDKNWVAHQLLEKSCSLRVSSKHGIIPFLEMEI